MHSQMSTTYHEHHLGFDYVSLHQARPTALKEYARSRKSDRKYASSNLVLGNFRHLYAIHLHTINAQMICNLCDRAGSLAQFAQVAPKNLMDGYFLVAASQRKSLPFFAVHSYRAHA